MIKIQTQNDLTMTNIKNFDYIIVGAGISGMSAAETISLALPDSTILMINNEPGLPYKRTRINKSIAKGFEHDEFALKSSMWFDINNITLLQAEVTELNTGTKSIITTDQTYTYGKLLLATGSRPRSTENEVWDRNMFHVRTASQVESILASMQQAKHYLLIGGGAEGVETAEQLMKAGKQVTLIDRNQHLMHHYLTQELSQHLRAVLIKNAISVINPASIKEIQYSQTFTVELTDRTIAADAIISCIGHIPDKKLASTAGIGTNRGIKVDQWLQTDAPDVFAAGDVAEHPEGRITGLWHAAEYQGKVAALNMMGQKTICENRPYRFKTEVFGEFYFSGGTIDNTKHTIIRTIKKNTVREVATIGNKITGILSLNEAPCAKLFQQALMERWSNEQLETGIKKLHTEQNN